MLSYKLITNISQFEAINQEWKTLFEKHQVMISDRMQDIDVINAYLKLYEHSKQTKPCFIFIYQEEELIAISPFYTEQQVYPLQLGVIKLFSFKLKALKLFGDKPIVVKPELYSEVIKTIALVLKSKEFNFDLLSLDKVPTECDPLWKDTLLNKPLMRGLSAKILNNTPEIVRTIDCPPTYDEYLSSLTRKSRYKYKKSVSNFCTKNEGKYQFRCFKEANQVSEFFGHVNTIYPHTWQAKTFGSKKRDTDEVISIHTALAQKQHWLSYVLFIEEQPIAFILGYCTNGQYLYFEIGYNDTYKNSEPGKVLAWMLIEDLYKNHEVTLLDFDTGENNYKKVLGNQHYFCNKLLLTKSYSLGSAIVNSQVILKKLYQLIVKVVETLKLEQKIRNLVKRKK